MQYAEAQTAATSQTQPSAQQLTQLEQRIVEQAQHQAAEHHQKLLTEATQHVEHQQQIIHRQAEEAVEAQHRKL